MTLAAWSLLLVSALPVLKVFMLCSAGTLLAHVVRFTSEPVNAVLGVGCTLVRIRLTSVLQGHGFVVACLAERVAYSVCANGLGVEFAGSP